jgi:gamma-glutamyltranspeptidase/glutathione hydrolase
VPITWHATLRVALDAAIIARYPETAATFLPNGHPLVPAAGEDLPAQRLVQPALAATLERLARNGPDEIYRGETAGRIVAAMRQHGGLIGADDLATYRAEVRPAPATAYRGWRVSTIPPPSGGPTLLQTLRLLGGTEPDLATLPHNSAEYLLRIADAQRLALEDRYGRMGDGADWDALLSDEHLAGLRERLARQERPAPRVGEPSASSTTHLATADDQGNLVSCTQTLLSAFGSRVTIPGTGMLCNNGMFWFNPVAGSPNAPGPGKRPLSNMTPLIAEGPGGWPRLALGSSGGRRIMGANLLMALAVMSGGLGLAEAIAAPRVDASTDALLVDSRLPAQVQERLAAAGYPVVAVTESTYPQHFASPAAVLAREDGTLTAAVDPLMPAATAVV